MVSRVVRVCRIKEEQLTISFLAKWAEGVNDAGGGEGLPGKVSGGRSLLNGTREAADSGICLENLYRLRG